MRKNISALIAVPVLLVLAASLHAVPRGEFSVQNQKRVIGTFHLDLNSRDWNPDRPDILDAFGFGFGFHRQLTVPDSRFSQHKLFYLSFDNSLSGFRQSKLLYSLNLGFTVRTVIPFFKLMYGTGVNFKIGNTPYPPWGVYGIVGIDFHNIMVNMRVIFHPGTDRFENELQLGYVFLGRKYR